MVLIIDPEIIDGMVGHWWRIAGKLVSGLELGFDCPAKHMKVAAAISQLRGISTEPQRPRLGGNVAGSPIGRDRSQISAQAALASPLP